jgi:hypothetical protein
MFTGSPLTPQALRKEVLQADGRIVRHLATNLTARFRTEPVLRSTYRSAHSGSVTCVGKSIIKQWFIIILKPCLKQVRPKQTKVFF